MNNLITNNIQVNYSWSWKQPNILNVEMLVDCGDYWFESSDIQYGDFADQLGDLFHTNSAFRNLSQPIWISTPEVFWYTGSARDCAACDGLELELKLDRWEDDDGCGHSKVYIVSQRNLADSVTNIKHITFNIVDRENDPNWRMWKRYDMLESNRGFRSEVYATLEEQYPFADIHVEQLDVDYINCVASVNHQATHRECSYICELVNEVFDKGEFWSVIDRDPYDVWLEDALNPENA